MADSITAEEIRTLREGSYHLIDIRTEDEFAAGSMPGAVHIDREILRREGPGAVAGDEADTYIFLDMFGTQAGAAADDFAARGLKARYVEGGYGNWILRKMRGKESDPDRCRNIEQSLRKRFRHDITGRFVKALTDYRLLQPGDRVAVCISGGKDSMLMAKLFQEIKRRNKFPFDVVYLCMNPGYSDTTLGMIESNAKLLEIPLTIFETRIFDAVDHIPNSPCYICARMRRGFLYRKAKDLGCNKIALGHHYDDVIQTTLMSILYSGQTQTMMPKLHSEHFEGMELIRPLYLVREDDIKAWRDYNDLHFIRCACHFTEMNSIENGDTNSKRIEAKKLIRELRKTTPSVEGNIFRSMENIMLNACLGWKKDGERHSFLDEYDRWQPKNGGEQ